jgi:hypothetical protein
MYKILFSAFVIMSTMSAPCSPRSASNTSEEPEDLLTAKTWLINEITYVQDGQLGHYKKGSYSVQFLNDRIKFEKDGTGLYTNTYNEPFKIGWAYNDGDKKKITLVINNYRGGRPAEGKSQEVNIENINVSRNDLYYTEIYKAGSSPTMSSVHRIPAR